MNQAAQFSLRVPIQTHVLAPLATFACKVALTPTSAAPSGRQRLFGVVRCSKVASIGTAIQPTEQKDNFAEEEEFTTRSNGDASYIIMVGILNVHSYLVPCIELIAFHFSFVFFSCHISSGLTLAKH